MVTQPILLRIHSHATPHKSDPPNAHEFYTALGMLTVAWGRLEGHIISALVMILALQEASAFAKGRNKLWKQAFNKIPALKAHEGRAIAFMGKVIDETKSRNFAVHAIWDAFKHGAAEPTVRARTINPQKGHPNTIEVRDGDVSLSSLKQALDVANKLNSELTEFTRLLHSLRPPPPNIRIL